MKRGGNHCSGWLSQFTWLILEKCGEYKLIGSYTSSAPRWSRRGIMVLLETCTWSNLILNECGEHKLVLASLTSKSKLDVLRRPTRKGGKMVV